MEQFSTTANSSMIANDNIFDDYSTSYDMMLEVNEPYKDLQKQFEREITKLAYLKDKEIRVLDIGGGTGNFSKIVAEVYPNASITIIEPNDGMLQKASSKIQSKQPIQVSQAPFEKFDTDAKYDLVICIHALYLMKDPKFQIPKIVSLVKPGGHTIICDIGKTIKVWDWSIYLFFSLLPKYGLQTTLNYFAKGRAVAQANKKIGKAQLTGRLWKHSLSQFKNYWEPFVEIKEAFNCYRGHSRFLVGKRNS